MTSATSTGTATRGGLGPIERILRIVGGGLVMILGVNLALASGGLATWAWLGAALLGLDFVVTGFRGYCPLYARLGIGRPRATRGARPPEHDRTGDNEMTAPVIHQPDPADP